MKCFSPLVNITLCTNINFIGFCGERVVLAFGNAHLFAVVNTQVQFQFVSTHKSKDYLNESVWTLQMLKVIQNVCTKSTLEGRK